MHLKEKGLDTRIHMTTKGDGSVKCAKGPTNISVTPVSAVVQVTILHEGVVGVW